MGETQRRKKFIKEVKLAIMHPKDIMNDAVIGDKYFDPDTFKLYEYIKFGEFPPEWVDITPYTNDL